MKRTALKSLIAAPATTQSLPAFAHNGPAVPAPLPLDELMTAFGWDTSKVEIAAEKVTDNLYVLFGLGGNIGVSLGDDGLLIVDD